MQRRAGSPRSAPSNLFDCGAGGGALQPRADGSTLTVGDVTVLEMSGGPGEFTLGASAAGPLVDFIFLEAGALSYRGAEGWVTLDAELVVISGRMDHRVRLMPQWNLIAVRLPREAIEALVPRIPDPIGTFARCSGLERAMRAFVTALMHQENVQPSAIGNYAIEQLLLEMGSAVLLDRLGGGWKRGAPQAVLRDRAMAVIAQQCADAELSPTRVARETRISLRQLQAVFAEVGTTVSTEIRKRRAHLAYTLLQEARYDVLTVAQIAERSGFGTTMSMRRALTEFYGKCPRDIRQDRVPVGMALSAAETAAS